MKVNDLEVHYGDFKALWDVSLEVRKGEIVSVIGANGAGKSTLLNTVAGLMRPSEGTIEFNGKRVDGLSPHQIVPMGMTLVPEGRRVFARLSVYENLVMGSYIPRARSRKGEVLERLYELFPRLKERRHQMADTLSGGEQQMLAVARAMMSEPKLMLCDEISLGLAPVIIKDIYKRLVKINQEGITIVLVEQDVKRSLKAADRAYVMLEGRIALEGKPSALSEDQVKKAYFGV
ncbi:MAG: ABC transporter ATP-binding protein [Deltaproteobacteria bacterium]|nr:ABC transporter ATP-binding protein [Deltaproteobacteria bacterium]MBW2128682.1 ABC transporter ATP-binding protein [Deltaproteobacteria bacterium]MBW2302739.1 ABC transporter ATP-binding protein [Deltaproteobacteria bacterium]